MKQIVYTPYYRVYIYVAMFGAIGCILLAFATENFGTWDIVGLTIYVCVAAFFAVYALSLRGAITMDEQGMHIMHPRKGELLFIPWTQIHACRFFPKGGGEPAVVVLFQNPAYCVHGRYLHTMDEPFSVKLDGHIVLCDSSLRKLCFGFMKPEEFAARDVFGITATETEYRQICKWWMEAGTEGK